MSKGWKIAISITVTALTLFGIYAGSGIYMLMQICYTMDKYRLKGFDGKYFEIDLNLKVYNPSFLTVGIKGYTISILLNGKPLGVLSASKATELKTKDSSNIVIPLKIDPVAVFGKEKAKEISSLFLKKEFDKIVFSVDGKLYGSLLGISKEVPVKSSWSLKEIAEIMSQPSTPCKI